VIPAWYQEAESGFEIVNALNILLHVAGNKSTLALFVSSCYQGKGFVKIIQALMLC
jgi:hypothetical protein